MVTGNCESCSQMPNGVLDYPPFSTGFPSHVELLEGIANDLFKGGVILSFRSF